MFYTFSIIIYVKEFQSLLTVLIIILLFCKWFFCFSFQTMNQADVLAEKILDDILEETVLEMQR